MPGGIKEKARRLEAEGHIVKTKGKTGLMVEGFDTKIAKL
jgi:hypothetical protein